MPPSTVAVKVPETVTLTAVIVPVNVGLALSALELTAD
jgi:hypothetical protein